MAKQTKSDHTFLKQFEHYQNICISQEERPKTKSHYEWNLIMEMVEFIETCKTKEGYGYQVFIHNNLCEIEASNYLYGHIHVSSETKKDAVWKAVRDWFLYR